MNTNELVDAVVAYFNELAGNLGADDYRLACGILAAEFGILAAEGEEPGDEPEGSRSR